MVVAGEETVERGLRVPLELQQVPPDLEIARRRADDRRRRRARRVGRAEPRVDAGDVVAVLDLHAARTGPAPVPADAGAGARAVRRRGRPGDAVGGRDGVRDVRVASRCRSCPAVDGRPAPGYVVGTDDRRSDDGRGDRAGERGRSARPKRSPSRCRWPARASRVRETVTLGLLDPSLRLKNVALGDGRPCRSCRRRSSARCADRPVHLRNLAANLTARGRARRAVDVAVRGSREALGRSNRTTWRPTSISPGSGAGEYHADGARRFVARRGRDAHRAGDRFRCGSTVADNAADDPRLFGTDGVRGMAGTLSARSARRSGASAPRSCARCRTARESAHAPGRPRHARVRRLDREPSSRTARRGEGADGHERRRRADAGDRLPHARQRGYDAGVVISASHNPFEDNGIKVFSGTRREVHRADRARGRGDRRRSLVAGDAQGDAGAGADAPISSARISIISARSFPEAPTPCAAFKLGDRLRQRRDDDGRAARCSTSLGFDTVVIGNQPDGRNINLRLRLDPSRARWRARSSSAAARWAWRSTATAIARSSSIDRGRDRRRRRGAADVRARSCSAKAG